MRILYLIGIILITFLLGCSFMTCQDSPKKMTKEVKSNSARQSGTTA